MINKFKNSKTIILFVFFVFGILAFAALAAEIPSGITTDSLIHDKILSAEQQINRERFYLRLRDARDYMDRGDRYYEQGKLTEALGEWYAALALLELLKEMDIEPSPASEALERGLDIRLRAEILVDESKRLAKMDEAVNKIVAQEEQLRKKEQELSRKEKEKPAKPVTVKEKRKTKAADKQREEKITSLQELEQMKKNRQAVEETISQEIMQKAAPAAKPELQPEGAIQQQSKEEKRAKKPKKEELRQAQEEARRQAEETARQGQEARKVMESAISQELSVTKGQQLKSREELEEKKALELEQTREQEQVLQKEGQAAISAEVSQELKATERPAVKKSVKTKKKPAESSKTLQEEIQAATSAEISRELKASEGLKPKEALESGEMLEITEPSEFPLKAPQEEDLYDRQLRALDEEEIPRAQRPEPEQRQRVKAKSKAATQTQELFEEPAEDNFDLIDRVLKRHEERQGD